MLERESVQKINSKLKEYIEKESKGIRELVLTDGESSKAYFSGDYFGEKDHYYTITGELIIPIEWQESPVSLIIYSSETEWDNTTNPQMKLYLNDQLIQAFDVNHREAVLSSELIKQKELTFRLEIYSGREEKQFPVYIKLSKIDAQTKKVFLDFYVALESWRTILGNTETELIYQNILKKASHYLDFRTPYSESYYIGLHAAEKVLKEELYDKEEFRTNSTILAVGHTHIDLAWLWTVQQAIEKGERSFSTVLKLMEEYEDYTFIQSQPQMYQFIKDTYPELYSLIKEKITEGRWEPEGAMWVEADCNLTSGESLVRQIIYGKRFLKEEFNKESKVLWLPDVFGYSAALPQILKKTNTPYFMTTKLSWNQFNQIPYDTFYWKGIDGSEILTHFITTVSEGYSPTPYYTTYNGLLDPYTVKNSWERYQQKAINNEVMIAYGYGDGGGGPTREMLETAKRLKNGLPGIPKVRNGFGTEYFEKMERTIQDKKVPRWMGELYFEYHRGTYTSMAKNKKNNRMTENLLQTIEKLYIQFNKENYPQERLEKMWKLALLNQFHDILPGSSIKEVYEQTDKEYQEIRESGEDLISKIFLSLSSNTDMNQLYIYNPIGKERTVIVKVPIEEGQVLLDDNRQVPLQKTVDGKMIAEISAVPGLGGKILTIHKRNYVEERGCLIDKQLDSKKFETPFYKVTFNDYFEIVSLYDKKNQREIVPNGEILNSLNVYEDLPMDFDAWDIDIYYREKYWPVHNIVKVEIVEDGDIRKTIKIKRKFEDSIILQYIHFYQHNSRIDFQTKVDWKQQHLLLKSQFPVDINTLKATFDIQFGNVERSIHKNTSWDIARFEVCGQKWIDLSEGNYGVSLMSDSKYGFNLEYKNIGITLIKSATDPNPEADQGEHEFTYSLLPHAGTWKEASTVEEASDLNIPALVTKISNQIENKDNLTESWAIVSEKNIIIDTVKKAENGKEVIVRMYEYHNNQTQTTLQVNEELEKAVLCDLLENELEELEIDEKGNILIYFKPYEIQTIKLFIKDEECFYD